MTEKNAKQIVDVPLAHYKALYEKSDAAEIAERTGLPYDATRGSFELSLVGNKYYVTHPIFTAREVLDAGGKVSVAKSDGDKTASGRMEERDQGFRTPYEEILVLRYLLEGRHMPTTGAQLAYSEMPWGPVYINQFKGRVIGRIAREFGRDPKSLGIAIKNTPGLVYYELSGADAAYRFEVLPDLFMSILIWEGDDEFKPAAQVLFDDNFKYAFTAEDMAVIGDIVISRLKQSLKAAKEEGQGRICE